MFKFKKKYTYTNIHSFLIHHQLFENILTRKSYTKIMIFDETRHFTKLVYYTTHTP